MFSQAITSKGVVLPELILAVKPFAINGAIIGKILGPIAVVIISVALIASTTLSGSLALLIPSTLDT